MDDEVIHVNHIAIVKDRVILREVASDTIRYLQRSDISSFRIVKNTALEYALIGAAGGAAWVILTAGNWNDDNNAGYTFYWSAIYGGLTGGFGYLLGSPKSTEVTYTLQKETITTELDVVP